MNYIIRWEELRVKKTILFFFKKKIEKNLYIFDIFIDLKTFLFDISARSQIKIIR